MVVLTTITFRIFFNVLPRFIFLKIFAFKI
nr:MAG TPA: hypothetical protein [Bacteriophage sp.]